METGLDDKVNGALEREKKRKEERKNETDGGNTSGHEALCVARKILVA